MSFKIPKWIEGGYQGCKTHVERLSNYILNTANRTRMGFAETTPIGAWFKDKVIPAIAEFLEAFRVWANESERGHKDVIAIREAWSALEPLYLNAVEFLKSNPKEIVTDVDLDEMMVPPRSSGEESASTIAKTAPMFKVDRSQDHTIIIWVYNAETKRRGKPKDQHGVEARFVVTDGTRPIVTDDLVHSDFATRNPLVLSFPEADSGKILTFALRWENRRAQKGPFSIITSVMIP